MTETPEAPRLAETFAEAEDALLSRWPETRLEPSIDGEPLGDEDFVRAFNDVAPYLELVDRDQDHPLSFFETVVAMGYAAFADAPVDVAVVEVGMGGSWDATNVA